MTQTIEIKAGSGSQTDAVSLDGIPIDIWEKFKANAQRQFPKDGDLAWAAYLSEVIVAGSGGDGETVSYFMTKVPKRFALAVQRVLANVRLTWDQFHLAFLNAAAIAPQNVRFTNFQNTPHTGMYIAMGLNPAMFKKVEEVAGVSFERVMASILISAELGKLAFGPDTTFVEPANGQ